MLAVVVLLVCSTLFFGCDTRPRPAVTTDDDRNDDSNVVKNQASPLDLNNEPGLTACGRVLGALCRNAKVPGSLSHSEFGAGLRTTRDFDGDGIHDLAVGAPAANTKNGKASGSVQVISGASGVVVWQKHGAAGGELGRISLPVPDIDGDDLPDLLVTAPMGAKGLVIAVSPKSGRPLWQASGERRFGRALALAHDETGDGVAEVWVAGVDTKRKAGTVSLVDGKTGKTLRELTHEGAKPNFGMRIDSVADMNRDGVADLVVSGSKVYLFSGAASGELLHQWPLNSAALANAGDMDNDGFDDIAITADDMVQVVSGATLKLLWQWKARQAEEHYGKTLAALGDVNRDGHADLAIGAPGYRSGELAHAGRFELRSGKDGSVLAEAIGDGDNALGSSIAGTEVGSRRRRRGLWVGAPLSRGSDDEVVGAVELYEF